MKKIFTLLYAFAACVLVYAQEPNAARISMHVEMTEENSVINISDLQRIKFLINDKDQVQSVFVFEDQTEMTFDNVAVIAFLNGTDQVVVDSVGAQSISNVSDMKISVFPNPAKETLRISGMDEKSKGAIVSISGQYMCGISSQNTSIDISGWANGTYLIRIDDQIFKLIKQ